MSGGAERETFTHRHSVCVCECQNTPDSYFSSCVSSSGSLRMEKSERDQREIPADVIALLLANLFAAFAARI